MEEINRWFKVNIEDAFEDGINLLNYYVYKMEWPIIFLGIVIALFLFKDNRKKYSYRYELSRWLKIPLYMIITAYFIKILNIKAITSIVDVVFKNFIPITILGIIILYRTRQTLHFYLR